MTQEIGDAEEGERIPFTDAGNPVALVVGDGRDDWMLPDDAFSAAGCRLVRADGFEEAARSCSLENPDIVFMPLTLDGRLTNKELRACLDRDPTPVVVVVASNEQINTAAEAMRIGAYDCLFKPFSRARLSRTIGSAVKQLGRSTAPPRPAKRPSRPMAPTRRADPAVTPPRIEVQPPSAQTAGQTVPPTDAPARTGIEALELSRRGFVASSAPMRAVLQKAAIVAGAEVPVFISGEVGTGKTTLAGIVHELSGGVPQSLVTLSCATVTAREFDRHVSAPDGAFAQAEGGTLYLDEINDLSADVQARVLRFLEESESAARSPGIRIIASTAHPPATPTGGRLRPDLYYRLHVAPLDLPPLRAREDDPALIARVRLAEFSEIEGRGFEGFTETAQAMIAAYHWPGNLRELINAIRSLVMLNEGPMVTPELLPRPVRAALRPEDPRPEPHPYAAGSPPKRASTGLLVGKTLAEIERTVIEATIAAEGGSVPRAARVLDVSPSTLYRKREAWAKSSGR